MKYLRQLAILFAFCIFGDLLSALFLGKIPGNVMGMTLLFILLTFGILKLNQIDQTADFFLKNMAFFFLPACLGILDVLPLIRPQLFAILTVILLTTLITAAATAGTVHLVLYLQARAQLRKGREN